MTTQAGEKEGRPGAIDSSAGSTRQVETLSPTTSRPPLVKSKKKKKPVSKNPLPILISAVAVGVVGVLLHQLCSLLGWGPKGTAASGPGGWQRDLRESALWGSGACDIKRIDASTVTPREFTKLFRGKEPVLLTGPILDSWGALKSWTRQSLIERFGNRTIKVGIGSDIVNSGGGQGVASTSLADFLGRLDSTSPDLFTFDVDFISALPELIADFQTPLYFLSFNGELSRQRRQSWNMLSIGGSRRGLPFHVHGETWLGLVFGRKRWFLFPPGQGLASMNSTGHHPLLSVWHWFDRVLPRLHGPERPLQCAQQAGEVMYLPPGWKHLTLNVGETIGVGGQAVYGADQRLRDSLKVLKQNPKDFEAIFGVGLSLAHKALDSDGLPLSARNQYLNQSFLHFRFAATLRPCQPEAHLLAGEVLLAVETEASYARARSIMQHAHDLFTRPDSPCALPESLSDEERRSTMAHVHLKLGRFFLQAGDGQEAERALRTALSLMPTLAPAYADLSYVFAKEGRKLEMDEAMDKAVELAPRDEAMRLRLTDIRSSLSSGVI